jgi:DNA-binding NarL/FixJ family response regulator
MMPDDAGASARIHVLLADDHELLRHGLKLLLGLQPDMQIVGEARSGREAVEMTLDLKPDVVVMDISMPDMDGLEACQHIRSQHPPTQVLMLTMHESEEYFFQALRMGAAGYLVKKAAPNDLHAAIRTVAQGGAFLYPGLAKALVRAYITRSSSTPSTVPQPQHPSKTPDLPDELRVLTPREMEVLKLVAEGRTSQEIADQLVVSVKTVQAHRASIMEKLHLNDITHLVRFAIRHGLIPPEL